MTRVALSKLSLAAIAAVVVLPANLATTANAQANRPHLPFEVIVLPYTMDRDAAYAVASARAEWLKAFEAQELEKMTSFHVDNIYSYDLMAARTKSGPAMAFDGEPIWRANWASFFKLFEDDLKVTINDLTVYQTGEIATVRGLTRLEGTMAGGRFVDMWVRETNGLRLDGNAWRVVHDCISVPFDFATGRALTDLGPAVK